ncbi:4,5-DOPA dioxygenase extradiol [Massilibacteroides sp.]|uniref:4,5-DOPA-extradiol-dioxygenase n=1 Tax=Massilibacteroides sp. TaxID=2034766 RepID=UPI0026303DD1|nr:4,5-DOPA dioxygenase extradiol [Massilibacteroides sp.]MDD4516497.1 4,5-DOPA dioxygenase extradiol [Massilibacteroides sp.]
MINKLRDIVEKTKSTPVMPVLFVGHGSPMNAIEDNPFSRKWKELGTELPRPSAILCISAHWETNGTFVTAMPVPETIHDFGGFPCELFKVQYPASGDTVLAKTIKDEIREYPIGLNQDWGLDHGSWSVLRHIYPHADIPVLELSIDYTRSMQYHYDLAKELAFLRRKGVLIVGSGNMVHNLRLVHVKSIDGFNEPYGYDWALEMNDIFKEKIKTGDHKALINYPTLSKAAKLAIPTPDHYIPLLYALSLQEADEEVSFFNDQALAGSLTMTSVIIR